MSDRRSGDAASSRLPGFAERESGFEAKFAHDEELKFRAVARRDKLFALWAADRLGLSGLGRDSFIRDLLAVQGYPRHDEALVRFAADALIGAGAREAPQEVAGVLERLGREAMEQVLRGGAQPIDVSSR